MAMTQQLKSLFERDLLNVKHEIEAYTNESDLWIIDKDIKNCAGNLALHICGNLLHYFGAVLGNSEYIRERDREFSDKNIPKSEILDMLDRTIQDVGHTLDNLDDSIFETDYPQPVRNELTHTGKFLMHLYGHLQYHAGQINYHRRLLGRKD